MRQLPSGPLLHRQFHARFAGRTILQDANDQRRGCHREGPIKTFTLRGIKESPPYLHDGRLLTLEDTVEFFNLILETRLTSEEKTQLVAFLRQL